MLLNGGVWNNKRILSAATVKRLTTPHTIPLGGGKLGERTYGWDVRTPYSGNRGKLFTPGSGFGHTGWTGTSLWIDPASETAVILLTNRVHPDGKGDVPPAVEPDRHAGGGGSRTGASGTSMKLALLQLSDSALPIGGYSHSWGVEAAVWRGQVSDAPTLERWVRCWLRYAAGPFEGVVVGAACRAATAGDWPEVSRANELLAVSLTPPTLRVASGEMGEHLLALAEAWPWAGGCGRTSLRNVADAGAGWHHAAVFRRPGRVGGRLSP